MISAAAGMAAAGKIAFASTFGRFLERAFDQVEMALIGGADIKLVGTHVGVTLASDGPSQMALADMGFVRALAHVKDHRGHPALTVLTPADAVSAYAMTLAMAAFPSACYLRAARADLPTLYGPADDFPFRGHKLLRPSDAPGAHRLILVATGYMVHSALKAADALKETGIEVGVVDAYCLPMNAEPILALAGAHGKILAIEDSYVGGIGSELAEASAALANGPEVHSLAVHRIPKSGRKPDDVLAYVQLSVDEIVLQSESLKQVK